MNKKLLFLLVLLLTAATGAWAQTETLLTTIESTANQTFTNGSKTFDEIATVTFSAEVSNDGDDWGWFSNQESDNQTITVTAASDAYTITRVKFYSANGSAFDEEAPFLAIVRHDGNNYITKVNGTSIGRWGLNKIEVYGYEGAATPTAAGYTVSLKDGVKDAGKWTVKAGTDGSFQSLPLKGVTAGTKVKLKYDGDRSMVKGVTAVKKAAVDPAKDYLKWDADQKKLVATPMPESFTTVTSENTEWSAGTYVVEGPVEINRSIELSGDVNLIIKDGAKLTVYHIYGDSHNLSIYGQAKMTGELDVHYSGGDAINEIPTLEVHSAKVTATSSESYGAGFGAIGTFNVYGGSVDAKGTHAEGGCGICLGENGSMNIYGGEVKAEGKGIDLDSYGITCAESLATTVKVYGGKLWAGCADNSALDRRGIALTKGDGFTGKIEYSMDNYTWESTSNPASPYVRVGY